AIGLDGVGLVVQKFFSVIGLTSGNGNRELDIFFIDTAFFRLAMDQADLRVVVFRQQGEMKPGSGRPKPSGDFLFGRMFHHAVIGLLLFIGLELIFGGASSSRKGFRMYVSREFFRARLRPGTLLSERAAERVSREEYRRQNRPETKSTPS